VRDGDALCLHACRLDRPRRHDELADLEAPVAVVGRGDETPPGEVGAAVRSGTRTRFVCCGCGTAFPPASNPPQECSICADWRLRSPRSGGWTTLDELRGCHESRIEELEPGLVAIGIEPSFALGQRALLVDRVLWDCVSFLDEEIADLIAARGGVDFVAISHPHAYGAMGAWAREFGATVLIHSADRDLVVDCAASVHYWSGERLELGRDLELHRLGGPFPGASACLWRPGADGLGALLVSNPIHVVPNCEAVAFAARYGEMLPLPGADVWRIGHLLGSLSFDRLYGSWWGRAIQSGARTIVARSVNRYLAALDEPAGASDRRAPEGAGILFEAEPGRSARA